MRALIAAACRIRMRWPMMAQAAASYGDQKPTGRSPGYRRCSPATTGSRSPTAGNPDPSTSSDRIRATCARTAASASGPGAAGLMTSHCTPPGCSSTRTPAVCHVPSTGNASSSGCPAIPVNAAGVKPSRNPVLADSENGPRALTTNVSIAGQPCTVMA
jgi:hypothetical protein